MKFETRAVREVGDEEDVVAQPQVQRQTRRNLPVVLDEGAERAGPWRSRRSRCRGAAGSPAEHELGEAVAGVAAVLRIGGELAIEGELAAREARRVAVNVLVLELDPGLEAVRAGGAEQDVVELEQVEVVRVRPETARSQLGVTRRA